MTGGKPIAQRSGDAEDHFGSETVELEHRLAGGDLGARLDDPARHTTRKGGAQSGIGKRLARRASLRLPGI